MVIVGFILVIVATAFLKVGIRKFFRRDMRRGPEPVAQVANASVSRRTSRPTSRPPSGRVTPPKRAPSGRVTPKR